MSFNAIGQLSTSHKVWDHVGNAIPEVEFCEGQRPAIPYKVARWLPVQFYDKYYEDWWVIMPGKGVAFDNNGHLVPAGLGVTGATIAYTANDVTAGVIDVTTGVAVAGAVTYDVADIDGTTKDFLGQSGVALSVSPFVGVCQLGYRQWAGDGGDYDNGVNPAGFSKYNYNMQHAVTFLTDYVLEVPLVPAQTSTEGLTFTAPTAGVSTNTGDALANLPVAKNTMRTEIEFADGGSGHSSLFLYEVDSASDVTSTGEWHINLETGIITVYSGSVTPNGVTVTYYNYASAPTGSNVSKFACALGDLDPGDFVKFNVDSNFVLADHTTEDFDEIVGQIIGKSTFPQSSLDLVKTAYSSIGTSATGALPAYAGQLDQNAGTANGGVPGKVHYAGAADTVVHINLISR